MRVETIGPLGAKMFFVGEAPGEEEDKTGKPFKGYAGHTLDKLVRAAGINRHECLIGNVAKERPPGNKFTFFLEDVKNMIPKPILKQWIQELKEEIEKHKPNIVVALGAYAHWALTGEPGIEAHRGYLKESTLVPGQKMIATYHPQAVNYDWKIHFQTIMDLRKALRHSKTPDLPVDNRRLVSNPSKREFCQYIQWLTFDYDGPVCLDVETTDPGTHIDILGLGDSPDHALAFRLLSNKTARFTADDELEIWRLTANLLKDRTVIGHNLAFDLAVIYWHNGIYCRGPHFDTQIAVHVCWPEAPRSLSFLSSICLAVPAWKHTAEDNPALYNAGDVANTFGCYEFMKEEIIRTDSQEVFDFEMSQLEPSIFLHLQGLSVNREKQQKLLKKIDKRTAELKEEIAEKLGRPVIFHSSEGGGSDVINLNSSQQLQTLLYGDLGLPPQYKRRKSKSEVRKRTVDEQALTKLERISDNPIFNLIIQGKKLGKLKTFVDIPVSPAGKVHTNYNITGAKMVNLKKGLVVDEEDQRRSFGRWSSSASIIIPYGSGNLQAIPKKARKIYVPPPGTEVCQADYVQAEAVVVAYEIRDLKMINMFKESFGMSPKEREEAGFDVHRITASEMFQVPLSEVTPEQRKVGKTLRHAKNYSAGPVVLMNNLGCSMKEAKLLMSIYDSRTPQLGLWHQVIQKQLRDNGRVLTNLFGRKHRFLDRWPAPGQDGTLFRSAYSYKPQSTVGDLLNRALCKFYYKHGHEISIGLQLHDAIYVWSPLGYRKVTCARLWECMKIQLTSSYGDKYYIDVDFAFGPTWGDTETYNIGTRELER